MWIRPTTAGTAHLYDRSHLYFDACFAIAAFGLGFVFIDNDSNIEIDISFFGHAFAADRFGCDCNQTIS